MHLSPPAAPETSPTSTPDILTALRNGAAVITSTQRAARTLRRRYDQRQRAESRGSWPPPFVLAWESWCHSLWHALLVQGHTTSLLLHRTQELALWRGIVAADVELRTLQQPETLATLAADAWATLHAYQHAGPLTGPPESTDEAAFRRWSAAFRARCRRDSLLTTAELEAALQRSIAAGQLRLSAPHLILVGFDQLSPKQRDLLAAVSRSGVSVTEYRPDTPDTALHSVSAESLHAELQTCAAWAHEQMSHRPDARIAIIVPDIAADRPELDRVLRETLCPELENIELHNQQAPYEFSLGIPLGNTASVAAALDLLTWSQQPIPSATVSRLLLSRYFVGESFATERLQRALLDATRSRSQLLRPERSIDDLLRQLMSSSYALPGLSRTLRAFHHAAKALQDGANRSYLEWSEHIRVVLDAAGWIPAAESSLEYQVRERWQSTLDEFATLDFGGQPVTFPQALRDLKRLTAETIFAPETHDARVQVLGPLEAAGSTFDALWFLRCGDLTFPATASSNPLLPLRLRQLFRLPGSSPAEDTARARRLLRRLLSGAPQVVISYAQRVEQGTQKLASVAAELQPTELAAPPRSALPDLAAIRLIPVAELPLPPPPNGVLNGGAALLADQAACGFRAFAQHRLGSKPLEDAAFGFDPRARGEIVHRILQEFWAEFRTQSALRAISPEVRQARLGHHIDQALSPWLTAADGAWDRAYLDVQRSCLASVLDDWLKQELLREPFEVRSREQRYEELAVGPLRLSVRVDRIDRTESGGAVLIDYKTGVSTPKQWLSDRPDAPQLPLYTLLPEAEQLDAVSFGIVRTGRDLGFAGYEARPGVIPGAARLPCASLAELQQQWRETLEQLARDFHTGNTQIRPKNYPATCTYCAQRLLCRLDPSTLMEGDPEQHPDEEDIERG